MKQLLVLSGKGGTGKTTVSAAFIHLSKALGYADCDVDAPNLHLVIKPASEPMQTDFFGMGQAEIQTLKCKSCGLCQSHCKFDAIKVFENTDHLIMYSVDPFACEGCGVCERICPESAINILPSKAGDLKIYPGESTFSTALLKMGKGNSGLLVTEVKKKLRAAVPGNDLTIVDGSPGIGCPVIASLSGSTMALIVAEPSLSGISDLKRILETANKMDVMTAVCINKYDTNLALSEEIEALCRAWEIPFTGKIPYDENVVMAVNNSLSIVELDCRAGAAVQEVYRKTMHTLDTRKESESLFILK